MTLIELLQHQTLIEVVDIGANPIDGEPPYKILLDQQICRITGFEPQLEELSKLNAQKSHLEQYLPYVVGDGFQHTLYICRYSGMTSLFKPDQTAFNHFEALKPHAEVIQQVEVETKRLDDIEEIDRLDFLKIDIQGAELSVFKSGCHKLSNAVVIQTEISFMTLYEKQPAFGEIDIELRAQGFVPHCFAAVKHWPIAPFKFEQTPTRPLNQLLEADLVYVRDFTKPELMDDLQLKHLATIAHFCYSSYDLCLNCIVILQQRGVLPDTTAPAYVEMLNQAFNQKLENEINSPF